MTTQHPHRIWHVGNWCIHLGQTYVESPFKSGKNDVELLSYAQPFVDAIIEIHNQGTWHPLLAARDYSSGRVTCWTTGASPHRGINFMIWNQYPQFWKQVFAA